MHIDDLKYLRDPMYSYGDWLSVGQVSKNGRFVDNPGDPENWSNSYTQYIAEAAWRSYQIHGGQPAIAANLAKYAEGDVKGQLAYYDTNNNGLIEYDWGALTGNDADAVSFHWRAGNMDRAEARLPVQRRPARRPRPTPRSATPPRPTEMQAARRPDQNAIVTYLWNPTDKLFEHRHVGRRNSSIPWKEINNYYPFAVGADAEHRRVQAGAAAVRRPGASTRSSRSTPPTRRTRRGGRGRHPGSNNFSTINSTVQFRLLLLGAAQLPEPVDHRRATTRSCSTGTPGRSTSAATPPGRTRTSSGPTGTRHPDTSTTAPGSTTTSSAAATGRSSRTWPACGRATTPRSSCRRSTSAGTTSPSTTCATATPT